jgi:hypothetical protein
MDNPEVSEKVTVHATDDVASGVEALELAPEVPLADTLVLVCRKSRVFRHPTKTSLALDPFGPPGHDDGLLSRIFATALILSVAFHVEQSKTNLLITFDSIYKLLKNSLQSDNSES